MVPSRTDPRWQKLVENPDNYSYSFLALKILMSRVARNVGPSTSPSERAAAIDEVYALFQKHERLMGDDIAAIFG
jgi:hypothetical protein